MVRVLPSALVESVRPGPNVTVPQELSVAPLPMGSEAVDCAPRVAVTQTMPDPMVMLPQDAGWLLSKPSPAPMPAPYPPPVADTVPPSIATPVHEPPLPLPMPAAWNPPVAVIAPPMIRMVPQDVSLLLPPMPAEYQPPTTVIAPP